MASMSGVIYSCWRSSVSSGTGDSPECVTLTFESGSAPGFADPDPGSSAFLMGKKLRSGSGMRIRDEFPGSYFRDLINNFLGSLNQQAFPRRNLARTLSRIGSYCSDLNNTMCLVLGWRVCDWPLPINSDPWQWKKKMRKDERVQGPSVSVAERRLQSPRLIHRMQGSQPFSRKDRW
jgi:hypothetical protein